MPFLFSSTCTECKEVFGGPTHIVVVKRKSGEWEKIPHPCESYTISALASEDEIPNEEIASRVGTSTVAFCKSCGETVLVPMKGVGGIAEVDVVSALAMLGAPESEPDTACKCGCKEFVQVSELRSQDIDCPKCKKGKLHGGCFGIS